MEATHNKLSTLVVAKICAVLSHFVPKGIITNALSAKNSHISFGYKASLIKIIPNGIDTEEFVPNEKCRNVTRKRLGFHDHVQVVGMVARFDSQKNFPGFFKMANILSERNPKVRFLLVGPGLEKANSRFNSLLSESNSAESFSVVGASRDVPALLNAMDVFVLTSHNEGWPNVVAEAMACSKVCFATRVGAVAKIIDDDRFLVDRDDMKGLADRIDWFLSLSCEEREKLGRQARQKIISKFCIEEIAERYLETYRSVIKGDLRF